MIYETRIYWDTAQRTDVYQFMPVTHYQELCLRIAANKLDRMYKSFKLYYLMHDSLNRAFLYLEVVSHDDFRASHSFHFDDIPDKFYVKDFQPLREDFKVAVDQVCIQTEKSIDHRRKLYLRQYSKAREFRAERTPRYNDL